MPSLKNQFLLLKKIIRISQVATVASDIARMTHGPPWSERIDKTSEYPDIPQNRACCRQEEPCLCDFVGVTRNSCGQPNTGTNEETLPRGMAALSDLKYEY